MQNSHLWAVISARLLQTRLRGFGAFPSLLGGGEGKATGENGGCTVRGAQVPQGRYPTGLQGMGGEDAVLFVRESFELADLSPPLHPTYLWYPCEEMGEGPSGVLQGGCAPTMAAIEHGWVWPYSSHSSA